MRLILNIALCCVFINYADAITYKAAVRCDNDASDGLLSLVYEAGKKNADILVLPSDAVDSKDYDVNIKTLSNAAKQAGLYLVAHLKENIRCDNRQELVRSNLVFDRQGAIVAVYRKPENTIANCTALSPGLVSFETDFGVTFGVMMEEDLVLGEELQGLKNFVVTGDWSSVIPYYSARRFAVTWSYTRNVNLISSNKIYAGKAGAKSGYTKLMVADLKSDCDENQTVPPVINAADIKRFPGEDLSQYIIKPLNLVAGNQGYKETVCHKSFCCEFDMKIGSNGQEDGVSYGLAAFDGIRHYGDNKHIGVQNCIMFACAGLYKRSCSFGSINNSTNISFKKLSVHGNFSNKNTMQYPVMLSNEQISTEQFKYITKTASNKKSVTMTLAGGDSLLTFGISGRVFDRDYENYSTKENNDDYYNYIFNEDMLELFDYLWIRIRILMFVVSIYILEMM